MQSLWLPTSNDMLIPGDGTLLKEKRAPTGEYQYTSYLVIWWADDWGKGRTAGAVYVS